MKGVNRPSAAAAPVAVSIAKVTARNLIVESLITAPVPDESEYVMYFLRSV
jgi:hypothetical protein